MPTTGRPGGRWNDHRTAINGMFWVLNSGVPWRDMPTRYGKCKSVYDRYSRWAREGFFDRILDVLHLQLDELGCIDWSQFDVDGTSIRTDHAAAGARKKHEKQEPNHHSLGRSRRGWGSKLHLVTDGQGVPLAAVVPEGSVMNRRSSRH